MRAADAARAATHEAAGRCAAREAHPVRRVLRRRGRGADDRGGAHLALALPLADGAARAGGRVEAAIHAAAERPPRSAERLQPVRRAAARRALLLRARPLPRHQDAPADRPAEAPAPRVPLLRGGTPRPARPPRPLRPTRPVRDAGRAADGQVVPSGLRAGSIEAAGRADGSDGVRRAINQSTRPSTELLAGLLCAGLWPNVAVVHAPKTKKGAAAAQHVRLQTRKADNISPDPEARPLPRAQPRPQTGLRRRPWMGRGGGREARGWLEAQAKRSGRHSAARPTITAREHGALSAQASGCAHRRLAAHGARYCPPGMRVRAAGGWGCERAVVPRRSSCLWDRPEGREQCGAGVRHGTFGTGAAGSGALTRRGGLAPARGSCRAARDVAS